MGTPLDNFEFETVKQLRKSLLISSTVGIALSYMIHYSTGCISLFGFDFEPERATIITKLVGFTVFFFWASFFVMYRNDELPKIYKKRVTRELDDWYGHENYPNEENLIKEVEEKIKDSMKYRFKSNEWLMKTKDIFLPLLLGIYSMVVCFVGEWAVF